MPQVCFYFQLHQPYRLRNFEVTELGNGHSYFSDDEPQGNKAVFVKVAEKSYIPMLGLLLELVKRYPKFVFTLSCSGVFLEQALEYAPAVVSLLKKLAATGQVEFLAETYYHSLTALYSPQEFVAQVHAQQELLKELFGVKSRVFRNTELIYSNDIAKQVAKLGFSGMLTEAVGYYLGDRRKTQVFVDTTRQLPLLLKHAELSDDVAFRFSDPHWAWFPLHADTYLDWVNIYGENEIVNLFMDFETFGEHQWESTGIFHFFAEFVARFLKQPWNRFVRPTQVFESVKGSAKANLQIYDVPNPISWADVNRDLTAWIDNDFQKDVISKLYGLEKQILDSADTALISDWRKLQTSDHFYYMCTKWSADGDVHAYFSPFRNPYEAYRQYSVILADLYERLM